MKLPPPLPRILIVDDDDVSVMAMQRMIRKETPGFETDVAHDGQEALEKLRQEAQSLGRLPQIIVTLDLNMPRMSGIEFLKAVRSDPALSRLVVFVFTTSDSEIDVQAAFELNAAGYIVKETGTEIFGNAMRMLTQFATSTRLPA